MSMAERRAELLADIVTHTVEVLRELGIEVERAEHCGHALADHLAVTFGGQVFSMPVDAAYRLSKRERAILADRAAGLSVPELALKWRMTERGIRYLLRRAERRAVEDAQQDLFESSDD